ncbi:NAD(P)/FAD-dependent oxidoreductase [Kallotenue papyrolyticum]|uniref:NAD(P)/FAD-dependent oxidoreductase n=1 Tax=Kallotenue papyrolyticum TaxID=1325125 RepID=UPI001378835E|nr:FAD/NAD(P)-binding oxidoreductase [Kallotenue papyrolyticum]
MARKNIVVLGGGSGGVVAAAELGRRLGQEHHVILVDRNPFHVYMPAFLAVMTGDRRAEDITRDLSRLKRFNVRVITATVYGIDPQQQLIHLDSEKLPYDYLVIALGLQTHPEDIPGFREGAQHAWELDAALRCHDALEHFQGGSIVVGIPPGPYRCPPAPFEALFSLDAYFKQRGLRQQVDIHYFAPTPRPSGPASTPPVWLTTHAEQRGVTTHFDFTIREVDADGRRVVAEDGHDLRYDLLFVVPPHRPAQVLLDSGIAEPQGITVNYDTLETRWEHIWAIGDAVNFPASKAGVVAHQQADLVAHNIAVRVTGKGHPQRFKLHTT